MTVPISILLLLLLLPPWLRLAARG